MRNTAETYAAHVAASIAADVEAGTPFGVAEYLTDGAHGVIDEGEPLDAYAWLNDVLDVEFVVARGEYRHARVCISAGGPTAWIETGPGELVVTWASAPVRRSLPREFVDLIDDELAQVWESIR